MIDFVRFVGKACMDTAYADALAEEATAIFDSVSAHPNVTIRFTVDDHAVFVPFREPAARDLMDVAALIYVADECLSRADTDDGWNRNFHVIDPVATPEKWLAVNTDLSELLRLLSGDEWGFNFLARRNLPPRTAHRRRIRGKWDVVCLFSGGLDSFCGAAQLLEQGKRVLLVGHQADSITSSSQKRLAGILKIQFPQQVELVQVRVARSQTKSPLHPLPEKVEDSHRPRSFLFLALACALASSIGANEVILPENGLIGLNIPLQTSRVGTLSTRTAHPLFIQRFNRWVNAIGAFQGKISNPFMYESKNGVCMSAPEWLKPHMTRSISCAHAGSVRWEAKPGIPECGYCIPCLYRRLALADLDLDDAAGYVYDVFQNLATLPPYKQQDLRALAAFAKRLSLASDLTLETLVCSNGWFDPAEVGNHGPHTTDSYQPWRDMLRSWAVNTLESLERMSSDSTKAILSLS